MAQKNELIDYLKSLAKEQEEEIAHATRLSLVPNEYVKSLIELAENATVNREKIITDHLDSMDVFRWAFEWKDNS